MTEFADKIRNIKAFAFDVDGVLTDGGILATMDGELLRVFDAKDGFALRMASMKGYHLAIITGGRSESIRKRFKSCGVTEDNVYLGSRAKIEDFSDFISRHGLKAEEVMYFGDDLPDIPVMQACGCGVCPSDAVEDVLLAADWVADRPGGKGCVRACLEKVMKAHGTWALDVKQYKAKF